MDEPEKGKKNRQEEEDKKKKDVMREAVQLFSPQRCVPDRDRDSPGTVGLTRLPEAGTRITDAHKLTRQSPALFPRLSIFHGKKNTG